MSNKGETALLLYMAAYYGNDKRLAPDSTGRHFGYGEGLAGHYPRQPSETILFGAKTILFVAETTFFGTKKVCFRAKTILFVAETI
jgi:hypothetical protein